ncbi:SWIM zinc finger family protein [Streptomyces sp. 3214.6]|uniref:SWIM zinc finger family protein n=1 Tax=Streptomyces sp. 3214.6 TaxID=1882757 RepID=UPI00090A5D1A|nr:SWIM zinc finger family protein [Streptomyces sp. 3214.6]SHH78498.1 Uncharacterized conserved protein, contains Zn finger domain [Streptomyces sp. 3214.6]
MGESHEQRHDAVPPEAEVETGGEVETGAAVEAGGEVECDAVTGAAHQGQGSRPADEARRALRAARERRQEQSAQESSQRLAGPAPRPGDAARAALRRPPDPTPAPTASTSATAPAEGAPAAADAILPAAPAPPADAGPAADKPHPRQGTTGARPADIAREALRAARAQARQDAAEAGEQTGRETAPGSRHPQPHPRPRPRADARASEARRPGRTRDHVAEERARAVRELLSDAFRMPPEDPLDPVPDLDPAPDLGPGRDPDLVPRRDPRPEHGPRPEQHPDAEQDPDPESYPDSEPEPVRHNTPTPPTEGSSPFSVTAELPRTPTTSRTPTAPLTPTTPLTPTAPRSMAAPSRDGDHRRTFPAFPPRTGGSFAETWWGNAWVTALEEGALDPGRLARGRGYAEQGNVDAITVTPGLVLAYVQGSRPRPYRVQVRLRTLGDEDWERFLDAAVERPGHIAALLDKELPESLADCGVPLLPGPGDLDPHCSCPDRGHPCKHAAALCYQTARLLDADPFVLLLLRGRGERDVLDALSRRNATRAARAAQEQEPEPLPGVRAAEALAERRLPPLPAPLPVPPHPEQPPAYPSAPNGPDSFALDHLATDAAARAHTLLMTGQDEIGELTLWQDAVRLAASRPGSGLTATTRALYASLASAAGRTPSELARAVAAWRQGGPDGLTVLEESWDPPAGRFDRARPLLLAADLPAFRPRRNHLTHPRGHVQLRFGRDGLWYAYESEPGHDDWWPRSTPDPDPVGALTGLGGSEDL